MTGDESYARWDDLHNNVLVGRHSTSETTGETTSETTTPTRPFSTGFHILVLIAIAWGVVLCVAGTLLSSTLGTVIGVVSGIGGLVLGTGYRIQARIGRPIARVALVLILILELLVTCWWIGSTIYASWREVDLLAEVKLDHGSDVRPGVSGITLYTPIPVERDGIELIFRVSDHNPKLGICAPFIEISAKSTANGRSATSVHALPDKKVWVDIPPHSKDIHLEITLESSRNDTNCSVDLSVSRATLRNK